MVKSVRFSGFIGLRAGVEGFRVSRFVGSVKMYYRSDSSARLKSCLATGFWLLNVAFLWLVRRHVDDRCMLPSFKATPQLYRLRLLNSQSNIMGGQKS